PHADDVFCADALPHDWLFPRVAAVVHHGGAGTTGAALRAGVPAIIVPFTMDQPFWGSRVAALGVGPTPLPRARLTQERLAEALRRTVADEAMRARAAALGARIRAEDGVAEAVAHYGRLASTLSGARLPQSATASRGY
ncbi:MAG TPA: nucleotide disphospho-sugar-binding domain-containing protein, partial [Myxococcaceae bacterium]|nr:nucleotide disphospho-sugar-binding domain-containing protein [Myxococcaceae bacterium]